MRRMKRRTSTNPPLTQTVMRLLVMARFKAEKQKCEEIGWLQVGWLIVFYVHLYKMHESDEFIAEEGGPWPLFAYC
jgi:hypothetical protein